MAGLQDRRLQIIRRRPPAALDVTDLVGEDDPPEYRIAPIVIRSNQSSSAIAQFQCRISQRIGNPKLRELRANGTNEHSLWSCALNNETAYHHVIARLNKAAGADVNQT